MVADYQEESVNAKEVDADTGSARDHCSCCSLARTFKPPSGLQMPELPLEPRLLSIADVRRLKRF